MTWIRLGSERDRLVNLDGVVRVEVVVCDEADGAPWAVEGVRPDGVAERLFEGGRLACEAVLDEVAEAVWAVQVGVAGRAPGRDRGPDPTT